VKIYDTMKRKKFGIEESTQKFWVPPEWVIDFLAIVWDKADNIPWIDGFWPKKAVWLINEIGTVDEIYKEVEKVVSWEKKFSDYEKSIQSCFKWKTFEKLQNSKENALLSKKLATIELQVDLWDFALENYIFQPDTLINEKTRELFKRYEFFSLMWENEQKVMKKFNDLWLNIEIIQDDKSLGKFEEKVKTTKKVVIKVIATSKDIFEADIVWISMHINDENSVYISRLHEKSSINDTRLKSLIQNMFDSDIMIIWHDIKFDLKILDIFLAKGLSQKDISPQLWLAI
jgi:DNA polymerase-1